MIASRSEHSMAKISLPNIATGVLLRRMALRVQPTPTVIGEEAMELLRRINEGVSRTVKPTPTPKLQEAAEIIGRLFGRAHSH